MLYVISVTGGGTYRKRMHPEDLGLQVPMVLEHDYISHTYTHVFCFYDDIPHTYNPHTYHTHAKLWGLNFVTKLWTLNFGTSTSLTGG